ncbi:MAG: SfnB family sulfur acquisition oxidoreductase [Gammaproteobacteria bacterium]|nr:SfnB family sulfur acquisition oxidoreductase [Gammaproteobacteria bacterium]
MKAERFGPEYKGPKQVSEPAHIVTSDAEALEIAETLAKAFVVEASARDRECRLPLQELDQYSQSGLWGLTIPKQYGGPEVSYATLAKVFVIVSAADGSLGQLPQNHYAILDLVHTCASEEQKRYFYGKVLGGMRLGNGFAERASKHTGLFETTLTKRDGGFVVNGQKFYSSGALLSHMVPIGAADEDGQIYMAFFDRDAPGLEIIDDWTSFGQRTTASGTILITEAPIDESRIINATSAYEKPSPNGPVCQIMHAAVDLGIAVAASDDMSDFVRKYTRPWIDSGQDHGYEDPYIIYEVGKLKIDEHAAEVMLARAGRFIDAAAADPNDETVAAASIAVAEAKALTTEVSIKATNKLFELAGTRSTLEEYNLDRHWRNARTHTLHDPVRWKYRAIGDYYLNSIKPPRHAYL